MVFLKVLGKKNFRNKISILNKINKGYFDKKKNIIFNYSLISKQKLNLIIFLKKSNLINFFKNTMKFDISFNSLNIKSNINNYNKIFLKYFENKPFFLF
jgi:hypothetical protein